MLFTIKISLKCALLPAVDADTYFKALYPQNPPYEETTVFNSTLTLLFTPFIYHADAQRLWLLANFALSVSTLCPATGIVCEIASYYTLQIAVITKKIHP